MPVAFAIEGGFEEYHIANSPRIEYLSAISAKINECRKSIKSVDYTRREIPVAPETSPGREIDPRKSGGDFAAKWICLTRPCHSSINCDSDLPSIRPKRPFLRLKSIDCNRIVTCFPISVLCQQGGWITAILIFQMGYLALSAVKMSGRRFVASTLAHPAFS